LLVKASGEHFKKKKKIVEIYKIYRWFLEFQKANMGTAVKGIVHPQKRRVKKGVPIDRHCPHTQSPMFLDTLKGLLLSFNLKKNSYRV
jgi:hypothetical protein